MPVFGTEQYLPGCLQSLLDQTYKSFEIIVVDDYSPGNCKSIVQQYQSINSNIRYIRHEKNSGTLAARFTGTALSAGDYVAHLNSDDLAKPEFIKVLLTNAIATGADIVGSLSGENKNCSYFEIRGAEEVLKAYVSRAIQNYNVWTKMYRREFILGIEYIGVLARTKVITHSEDLLFNVLCALQNPIYVNVPRVLVDYKRNRPDSSTNILDSTAVIAKLEQVVLVYETLRRCAGDYSYLVEELIARSAKSNYRNTFARRSEADLVLIKSCLERNMDAMRAVPEMLIAAELNRRLVVDKLNSTANKLDRLKKRLLEQKKQNRELMAKFDERADLPGGLSRGLNRIGVIFGNSEACCIA